MFALFALGYSGGVPLYLTWQTLQSWMTDAKVDIGTIAVFAAVGLPYTFKFAWAPLLDRFRLPFGGRRRGWLVVFQLALVPAIAVMGTIDPSHELGLLAWAALLVAFLSASQDVVIDAYKADVLAPHERTAGSAAYVLGYRVGQLVSGTLAMAMADHVSWRIVYYSMAGFQLLGLVGTWLADEPAAPADAPRSFEDVIARPFVDFARRLRWRGAALVLGFAALYRFGDYFMQTLLVPFLQGSVGFSKTEIAVVQKGVGFTGTLIGGLAAGALAARFGLRRMLVAFGVLAAMTNLLYGSLAAIGHNTPLFCAAIFVDYGTTALATAAFLSVLMAATSPAVSATQFALLTSLSSVGQRVFGPLAGDVVHALGWPGFFAATAAMALPGLALAWWIARDARLAGDAASGGVP